MQKEEREFQNYYPNFGIGIQPYASCEVTNVHLVQDVMLENKCIFG